MPQIMKSDVRKPHIFQKLFVMRKMVIFVSRPSVAGTAYILQILETPSSMLPSAPVSLILLAFLKNLLKHIIRNIQFAITGYCFQFDLLFRSRLQQSYDTLTSLLLLAVPNLHRDSSRGFMTSSSQ